jgi:hypothetical protein
MSYIVIAALLADIGVNYSLHQKGMVPFPPRRPDGGSWYFWGLEGGAGSKRQFGVNSDQDKAVEQLIYGADLLRNQQQTHLTIAKNLVMLALANQPLKVPDIAGFYIWNLKLLNSR